MDMSQELLDPSQLTKLVAKVSANEQVEIFACGSCDAIFVGFPDRHKAFYDGRKPSKQFSYNLPRDIRCPSCGTLLYARGSKNGYTSAPVAVDRFGNSSWAWLLSSAASA